MTATVTTDFREEFEAERLRRLRGRFLWYTGIFGGIGILSALSSVITFFFIPREAFGVAIGAIALNVVESALYVALFLYVRRAQTPLSRQTLVRFVFWIIVASGILQLPATPLTNRIAELSAQATARRSGHEAPAPESAPAATTDAHTDQHAAQQATRDEPSTGQTGASGAQPQRGDAGSRGPPAGLRIGAQWLASVGFSHILAALFIPWTPREAVRPLVPLLILFAILTLIFGGGAIVWRLVWIAGSPLIGVPGVTWCAWRAGRFRARFHSRVLRRSYKEMKRELVDARHIHEDLFPAPILEGAVRFVYRYEPMRQIGGDFLYAHRFPGVTGDGADEPLSIVMIDVTGHGVPAALTVNRLYGELERLFAEDPDIRPGDVLTSLNSYIHYTLAPHSVYATALCVRVDPGLDLLEWASGGHPPAFVRTVDGRLERLDSTSIILGACHGEDFDDGQKSMKFTRGDTLIAYTDGAIEARDATGRMPGVEGFQRWIVSLTPDPGERAGWAPALLRAVERHRSGPPADDTLIVEVYRPLRG